MQAGGSSRIVSGLDYGIRAKSRNLFNQKRSKLKIKNILKDEKDLSQIVKSCLGIIYKTWFVRGKRKSKMSAVFLGIVDSLLLYFNTALSDFY